MLQTHSSRDRLIEKNWIIIDLNHVFDVFLFIFVSRFSVLIFAMFSVGKRGRVSVRQASEIEAYKLYLIWDFLSSLRLFRSLTDLIDNSKLLSWRNYLWLKLREEMKRERRITSSAEKFAWLERFYCKVKRLWFHVFKQLNSFTTLKFPLS